MNIFDSLKRARSYFPHKEALIFKQAATSYRDLYQNACRLSFSLKKRFDIRRGDRVAIFLPNIPEFVASYFAIARLGAVAVSLNVMFKRDEVGFILNDCGAKVLVTTPHLLAQIPEVCSLEGIVCVGEASAPGIV